MKKFKTILNLISKHEKFSPLFIAAFCLLSFQFISAQQQVPPTPQPKITTSPKVVIAPKPNPTPPKPSENKKVVVNDSFTPAEKSIAVESKVNITLCVKEGNIKINGWDRDEIRAYVENGSQVGFKTAQTSPKSNKPVWVYVLGFDPKKNKEIKPEECLSGSEIELDVPHNANINLSSGESEIKIESVAKVTLESLGGDIYLNQIANGIDVTTYSGDLMVEKSSGQILLANTAGNIIAVDVSPSEIGDILKAKTNSGRIVLKGVEHRQIEASSTTGSATFDGELLNGGKYIFSATNGSIVLAVPQNSSCRIDAVFGFGAFASEIPLQNTLKKAQSLSAQLGDADATCNLKMTTGSGVIRLRKRQ